MHNRVGSTPELLIFLLTIYSQVDLWLGDTYLTPVFPRLFLKVWEMQEIRKKEDKIFAPTLIINNFIANIRQVTK